MASLGDIRAHFPQLLLHFQEVTGLLILVYPVCLVETHNFQSYTLCKLFLITTFCMTLLIIPDGACLLFPTFKFPLVLDNFFLFWSDCKNYFLQQHQNSFTMCWNRFHLLWLYKSCLEKSHGGGKIIFYFMVKRFDVDKGKLLVGSLMLSVVKGWEFKIPSFLLQEIPHQVICHVFASEKTGWSGLNGSDVPKRPKYGWHKECSHSK